MIDLKQYIGIPYEQLNCWALVRKFYADNLNTVIRSEPSEKAERIHWRPIQPSTEVIHDLLVFRSPSGGKHVGICIGHGKMIHSDEHAGVVIESYRKDPWKNRLQTIYRHI